MKCLVLDAMGVIFQSAHIVSELLIPFVTEKGGITDQQLIRATYIDASLGNISADELWEEVKLSPALEDEYLARYSLNPGIQALLSEASKQGIAIWCLSNDVSRWSSKLQEKFDLSAYLAGSIISADVGARKPDKKIFEALIHSCNSRVEDMYFIDDKQENVQAAQALGIESTLFDITRVSEYLDLQ